MRRSEKTLLLEDPGSFFAATARTTTSPLPVFGHRSILKNGCSRATNDLFSAEFNGRHWIRTSDFHRVRMAENAKTPGK
jgi:hypothetical protein